MLSSSFLAPMSLCNPCPLSPFLLHPSHLCWLVALSVRKLQIRLTISQKQQICISHQCHSSVLSVLFFGPHQLFVIYISIDRSRAAGEGRCRNHSNATSDRVLPGLFHLAFRDSWWKWGSERNQLPEAETFGRSDWFDWSSQLERRIIELETLLPSLPSSLLCCWRKGVGENQLSAEWKILIRGTIDHGVLLLWVLTADCGPTARFNVLFFSWSNNAYVSCVFEGLSCWFAANNIKNK